ncbi:MAG: PQQ-binding-like beta-propeller repeat protein [Bacteroidia bacterium]
MNRIILPLLLLFCIQAAAQNPENIVQTLSRSQTPTATEALIKVVVSDKNERPVNNLAVSMLCRKTNKLYSSKTDITGEARFLVLINNDYEINVDTEQNYRQISIPNKPNLGMTKKFIYTPTTPLNETVNGDTITQQLGAEAEPSNSRVLIKMLIMDLDKNPLANEPVFINEKEGSKVYHGVSDDNGTVTMLVPKGNKYLLSFKYERDVDLLDLVQKEGYRTIEIEYGYMGSQKIEEFYKTAKRDKNGFITEFMSTKVNPIAFNGTIEKTAQGFNINYGMDSPTPTPAAYDGMLLSHGGYYSRNFFSFDEATGKYNWGSEFAESGPSSAVVEDSVLLINTQSCTLYALEAYTGKMLWSKWLGPDLYSMPAISNGKVYAVYPNELGTGVYRLSRTGKGDVKQLKNVIACFDLKSGKILWQNWLDSEVLSSPVVEGNNVYLTCLSGSLYEFDKNNGTMLGNINDAAMSPPTIVNDKVFISVKNAGNETVAVYSANGLKPVKKISALSSPLFVDDLYKLSANEQMNFCGTRILHYKGKNYNVMGNKIICSNPDDGSVAWSALIPNEKTATEKPSATMPVVAGGKIVVSTLSGKVLAFEPANGKQLNVWETNSQLETPATIHKGWIYSGTEDGKTVSINTGDSKFSGWNMFGYNGSHNTVVR